MLFKIHRPIRINISFFLCGCQNLDSILVLIFPFFFFFLSCGKVYSFGYNFFFLTCKDCLYSHTILRYLHPWPYFTIPSQSPQCTQSFIFLILFWQEKNSMAATSSALATEERREDYSELSAFLIDFA